MPSSIPYCGLPPLPEEWLYRWNLEPVLLGVLVSAALLGVLLRRRLNGVMYAAGMFVLCVAFVSPLCALSSALFSVRAIHHMLVIGLAAPLLAFALPARVPLSLTAATLLKGLTLAAWHVPVIYSQTLSSDLVYWLLQGGLLAAAVLFWSALRGSSAPPALAALVGTMALMGMIGAILTFAPAPLYAAHLTTTWGWGLSPLEDQQLSGLIMWAISIPVYVLAAASVAARLVSTPKRGAFV